MEFIYTKNPGADKPVMVIDRHIGIDSADGEGIMGSRFLDEFFGLANAGKTACEVWINTPGGQMMEAYDIAGVMKRSTMQPDTLNIGMAASCGGWLQLAGKKARMMDYATFMCHTPVSPDGASDDGTKAMTLSVARLISEGSGRNGKPKLSVSEAMGLMARTTFLSAAECLEMGLCDEVVSSSHSAHYSGYSNKYEAGKHFLNSTTIINPNKMEHITLITNALDLSEDSSAKSIANAITLLKSELEKTNGECNDLRSRLNDAENKAKELQLHNECQTLVTDYANKIGTDEAVVADWINTAKAVGVAKVKNMLDNLPVQSRATRITDIVTKADKPRGGKMADVLAARLEAKKNKQ